MRDYEKDGGNSEEAIKKAIKYCRKHDILKEFLEKNATEVINMLMTEWNWDDALAVRYEEGLEDGLEKGREEGRKEGREKGLEDGRKEGREKGLEDGREEGLEEGREETARNALAEGVPVELVKKITGLDEEAIRKLQLK